MVYLSAKKCTLDQSKCRHISNANLKAYDTDIMLVKHRPTMKNTLADVIVRSPGKLFIELYKVDLVG